jgi:hypothetical protein
MLADQFEKFAVAREVVQSPSQIIDVESEQDGNEETNDV